MIGTNQISKIKLNQDESLRMSIEDKEAIGYVRNKQHRKVKHFN